jgi:hypothetical protein
MLSWTKPAKQFEPVANSLLFGFPDTASIQTEMFLWLFFANILVIVPVLKNGLSLNPWICSLVQTYIFEVFFYSEVS